jgi:hypothetical protein
MIYSNSLKRALINTVLRERLALIKQLEDLVKSLAPARCGGLSTYAEREAQKAEALLQEVEE